MSFELKAFLVFWCAFITDAVWAYYIDHTSKANVWRSSLSSSLIVIIGGLMTVEYVQDRRLIIAAAIGGFFGTFALVKYNNKKKLN